MPGPSVAYSYRYAYPSAFVGDRSGARLRLATFGGREENPCFFEGALTHPHLTALLLRTLSRVVLVRFHIPPAMLQRILELADPVVTSGGGMLRFEGFSGCCSAYARVDLDPAAYDGEWADPGTTNVDFNAAMRSALSQVRDSEALSLSVGSRGLALRRGEARVTERKVSLPLRWLKGFTEVQAVLARMSPRLEMGRAEAVRFLRSLPRTSTSRVPAWVVPSGRGFRLSRREAGNGVRIAGSERLRPLEDVVAFAERLRVYSDDSGGSSAWELDFGFARLVLAISAEVWRGFSGEGQILEDLAGGGQDTWLPRVRAALRWQSELRASDLAASLRAEPAALKRALSMLGSRGLVGYDLSAGAYFHRELPFDLDLVESLQPRLQSARKIAASGGVSIVRAGTDAVEAVVPGTDVLHRVRLLPDGARCTCPWFAKHQGARGPCKHVLAVQILEERRP